MLFSELRNMGGPFIEFDRGGEFEGGLVEFT
jgi:hypothetical protein